MHRCLWHQRCLWQSVAQWCFCQTEIKRGVWYASHMVVELSSRKVHQVCSFWPIIWCFTHRCLSTPRLHTWPSSVLCLHWWPGGHLRKPAIPLRWWLYTVCTNKICKREGKRFHQPEQRSWKDEGMGGQMESYFWTHKMQGLDTVYKNDPAIPDLYFGNTKLAVETELSIIGVAVDSNFFGPSTSPTSQKMLGRDLEHWGRLLTNLIPQEEQLSTKLKSVALWNMPVCHGWPPHQRS